MLYSFPPCVGHSSLKKQSDKRGSSSGTAQELGKEDMDESWKPSWTQETSREPNNRVSISGSWISCVVLLLLFEGAIFFLQHELVKFLFQCCSFHTYPFLCKSWWFQKFSSLCQYLARKHSLSDTFQDCVYIYCIVTCIW